jgi:hypothetical protein
MTEKKKNGSPGKIQQSSSLQLLYWSIVDNFSGGGVVIDFPLMIVVRRKSDEAAGVGGARPHSPMRLR